MEILAYSYRGPLKDLSYTGSVAVVNSEGKLLYYAGDPQKVAYLRSSAKPMQAMCALESGAVDAYGLKEEELAVLCSSHSGEEFHVKAIRSILAKAGLDESYLQCGVHVPLNQKAAQALEQRGEAPGQIHNNCSGKHTGMLITAKYLGEDLQTYYKPEHNVQRRMLNKIADLCQYDPAKIVIGIDGCGVPVHALPLDHAAWAAAKLSRPETLGEKAPLVERITSAMMTYPKMVSGTGRFDAVLMSTFPDSIFSKAGADGYEIVGIKDKGLGIAVKADDGNTDIRSMVVVETLRQLGYVTKENEQAFEKIVRKEVYNHKKELVGYTVPEFTLHKA